VSPAFARRAPSPEAKARAAARRRSRARFRDTIASVIFFAAGFYVVLVGVLGLIGHPRSVAPDMGPGLYWFAYVVSGGALLAGGLLVLRHQTPLRIAWWLCVIAAVPGFLLWVWGVFAGLVKMTGEGGPSATSELAAFGVLLAYLLLGLIGLRRAQAGYAKKPPAPPSTRPSPPASGEPSAPKT
jgi:hypothetical protein